jgi:putative membrane protein
MLRLLLRWIISGVALWVVSLVVPGFYVSGAFAAFFAALLIGFINATLGLFLKVVTFPLTILTLGLFWFVVNAAMIELASAFVPGFHIRSFASAFWGGIVLSLVNMFLKWLLLPREQRA